eukprot:scaffold33255_cov70-Cyclotella_meneghiniana.AAC.2
MSQLRHSRQIGTCRSHSDSRHIAEERRWGNQQEFQGWADNMDDDGTMNNLKTPWKHNKQRNRYNFQGWTIGIIFGDDKICYKDT